jgi:hypothetical protein
LIKKVTNIPLTSKGVVVASLSRDIIAEAGPLDGTLGEFSLATRVGGVLAGATNSATTEHLESSGKCLETSTAIRDIAISAVLVVNKKT